MVLYQSMQDVAVQPCPMCGDQLILYQDLFFCNSCGFPIEVDAE